MSIDTIEVMAKVILEQCAKLREEQDNLIKYALGANQGGAEMMRDDEPTQEKEAEDGDK